MPSVLNSILKFADRRRSAASNGTAVGRIQLARDSAPIYAIGDLHGNLQLLLQMEKLIVDDAQGEPARIILLGDMIDRGQTSAQVLDHMIDRQGADPGYLCLRGNHEQAMLDYLPRCDPDDPWLLHGGLETLYSYGVSETQLRSRKVAKAAVEASIPTEHLTFLNSLPLVIETPSHFFSHAGANPNRKLSEQTTSDLLWFKDGMAADYGQLEKTVVHGHEAIAAASVSPKRINVDTGAYATGKLCAVRIRDNQPPVVLAVERSSMRQTI